MDDGRIGHAELAIGGGVFYLADEYPELGLKAPVPQSTSVSLMLHVPDTDAALERARGRGAEVQLEPYENYGSRNATIVDPFGHRWMLSGPPTGAATPIQHGDVGYVSVWTPDADRAAAFYGHVLGWTYDPVDPPGHQHQTAHRALQRCRSAHPVLLLRGRRPRRRQAVDLGRRRNGRRGPGIRLRRGARRDRCAGHELRGVPAGRRRAAAGSQRRWARRTFVHHPRGRRSLGVQGLLQPGVVLDVRAGSHRRRLGGAAGAPDVGHRRRQHASR